MRLSTVDAIAGILSGMKLNRIGDKSVKTALVNDYIRLRKFVKEADEERKEIVDKFQSDWMDELAAVNKFRNENKPVVGHDEYLEAERDANKAISDLFASDVKIDLAPVKMDAFLTACCGEELTFEQIAFLQENGLIE